MAFILPRRVYANTFAGSRSYHIYENNNNYHYYHRGRLKHKYPEEFAFFDQNFPQN